MERGARRYRAAWPALRALWLLLWAFAVPCSSVARATAVFINEIHYDNAGSDEGEAVEVAGPAGVDLAGWSLVAYNGGIPSPSPYATLELEGEIPDLQGGHGVLGFSWLEGSLQNGGPDGVALVDPAGRAVQLLSYEGRFTAASGPAAGSTSEDMGVAESGSTPAGASLGLVGVGSAYEDFRWASAAPESFGAVNAGQILGVPVAVEVPIFALQGAGHRSPFEGEWVATSGIVTASSATGFYFQDPVGDGDARTSDAVYVYTVGAPGVAAGAVVELSGLVTEYVPGGHGTGNLSITELSEPRIDRVAPEAAAPPAASLIGAEGRLPPSEVIDDDALTAFLPELDGIDFFESLEGMRVRVGDAVAVSPLEASGELVVVAERGSGATGMNSRGGITLSQGDANPERIRVDFSWAGGPGAPGEIGVGDHLGDLEGVLSYRYGEFVLQVTRPITSRSVALAQERSGLVGGDGWLSVASFNVENLHPGEGDRLDGLAQQIVGALRSPGLLALQEVQDDDGPVVSEVVSARETLAALIGSVSAAGGPVYRALDMAPAAGADGGQPGGNIRVAYLYDPLRVSLVEGSLRRIVDDGADGVDVFEGSRKPLVARFRCEERELVLVNLHLSSRVGSDPLFGVRQPPRVGGSTRRAGQAAAVRADLEALLVREPGLHIVVLGDMNDFAFSEPLDTLKTASRSGLPDFVDLGDKLEVPERYSYLYRGNSQQLDHVLATPGLSRASEIDIVHVNAEFPGAASDHDPVLARFELRRVPEPGATAQAVAAILLLASWRRVRARRSSGR